MKQAEPFYALSRDPELSKLFSSVDWLLFPLAYKIQSSGWVITSVIIIYDIINNLSLLLLFQVSSVSSRDYHPATLLGLLPAQTINVYLGSTLRSMRDVLNDHKTAFAGYAVFAVEVLVGVLLMVWVVQKARIELSNALLADIGAEEKLLVEI